MTNKQEVKIVNVEDNSTVFFFKHSFKSALTHAKEYMKRNSDKFPMKVYVLSNKPQPFPKWELYIK